MAFLPRLRFLELGILFRDSVADMSGKATNQEFESEASLWYIPKRYGRAHYRQSGGHVEASIRFGFNGQRRTKRHPVRPKSCRFSHLYSRRQNDSDDQLRRTKAPLVE